MTPIDDLARNLALRSSRGTAVEGIRADARDLPFERMARAVATPMSRRRAFKVAAAAGVAAGAEAVLALAEPHATAEVLALPAS